MGLFSHEHKTGAFTAAGFAIACTVCGHDRFVRSEAQLHTAGLTFFQIEWLGRDATVLVCDQCGFLLWFGKEPEEVSG